MISFNRRLFLIIWIVVLTAQACVLTNFFQESEEESAEEAEFISAPTVVPSHTPTELPVGVEIATQTVSPTAVPDPIVFMDVLPIDQGDGEVLLWAGGALASSNAGINGYHAKQALGKPNTLACGQFVTAWQPAEDETEAWIELYYNPYILPNEIQIAMSYQPTQISKVEVVTLDAKTITIFDREVNDFYQTEDCPIARVFWLPEVEVLISTVRITLARSVEEEWTQIDAVGVVGWIGDGPTEQVEIHDWFEDDGGDFYSPRYYTNKNSVNDLTFAGETLWTASDGGVVAWDLDSLNPTPFTFASGLPSNDMMAITYCDWEQGIIVAGGAGGIATLNKDWGDFFTPIENPDENLQMEVNALACDDQRQQIWVGSPGLLSRYNLATQRWTQFGESDGLPLAPISQIRVVGEDVWVAMRYEGVAVLRGGSHLIFYSIEDNDIPIDYVSALAQDAAGKIWIASTSGLLEFNGQTWKLRSSSEINGGHLSNKLMYIDGDGSGLLWIADELGNVCQFDPVSTTCLQTLLPPDDDMYLRGFHVDSQGRIALGDFPNRVWVRIADEWFSLRTRDQALGNAYHAIVYAPDGNLWLAGWYGLQYFKASQPDSPWVQMELPENGKPHALYVASDGLWIGHTHGARFLPYLSEDPLDLPLGEPGEAIPGEVTAITVDSAGRTYFGTRGGVSIWDGSRFEYEDLHFSDEVVSPYLNTMYVEGTTVWVGASTGLFKFEDGSLSGTWKAALHELKPFATSVEVIMGNPRGAGLLVAANNYLYQFDGERFELVLELPQPIRSAYATPYSLWLATMSSGYYAVPMDNFGIYWDLVSGGNNFSGYFDNQAFAMSDANTLWIAATLAGGLQRMTSTFGQ